MRTRIAVALSMLLILGLLVPSDVWARRITAQGNVTMTTTMGSLTDLVVTAVTANAGLEKTVVQQLPTPGPLFVLPFFVDKDRDNPNPGDLDTILFLTDTGNSALSVILTVRDVDGNVLVTTTPISIPAHGTRTVQLSAILP